MVMEWIDDSGRFVSYAIMSISCFPTINHAPYVISKTKLTDIFTLLLPYVFSG